MTAPWDDQRISGGQPFPYHRLRSMRLARVYPFPRGMHQDTGAQASAPQPQPAQAQAQDQEGEELDQAQMGRGKTAGCSTEHRPQPHRTSPWWATPWRGRPLPHRGAPEHRPSGQKASNAVRSRLFSTRSSNGLLPSRMGKQAGHPPTGQQHQRQAEQESPPVPWEAISSPGPHCNHCQPDCPLAVPQTTENHQPWQGLCPIGHHGGHGLPCAAAGLYPGPQRRQRQDPNPVAQHHKRRQRKTTSAREW